MRYIACSNFSGWHLMKSLAVADRYGWTRFVAHQVYYSLLGREYEWELMPLGLDQKVGALVWSPLGWGRLTGKDPPRAAAARDRAACTRSPMPDRRCRMSICTKLSMPSTPWPQRPARRCRRLRSTGSCRRPTISSVIIGARNEEQLRQNLGAAGWNLTAEQVAALDKASAVEPVYPYWHQRKFFSGRNPLSRV